MAAQGFTEEEKDLYVTAYVLSSQLNTQLMSGEKEKVIFRNCKRLVDAFREKLAQSNVELFPTMAADLDRLKAERLNDVREYTAALDRFTGPYGDAMLSNPRTLLPEQHFRLKEAIRKQVRKTMKDERFNEVEPPSELQEFTERKCRNCGRSENDLKDDEKMRLCSGCKSVCYCSGNCQKTDWKFHKSDCKRVSSSSGGSRRRLKRSMRRRSRRS